MKINDLKRKGVGTEYCVCFYSMDGIFIVYLFFLAKIDSDGRKDAIVLFKRHSIVYLFWILICILIFNIFLILILYGTLLARFVQIQLQFKNCGVDNHILQGKVKEYH